jgi:hypothetical protein
VSEYVDALYREAAGYVRREKWAELAAVNRELAAQGAQPVKQPKPVAEPPTPRKPRAKRKDG